MQTAYDRYIAGEYTPASDHICRKLEAMQEALRGKFPNPNFGATIFDSEMTNEGDEIGARVQRVWMRRWNQLAARRQHLFDQMQSEM